MNISIKDVLQRIKPFFVLYLILLCGCFVIKLLYSKDDIYFAVNTRHTDFLDTVEPYITDLGNGWTIVILAAILALYNYRIAFLMLTTFLVTSLGVQIAKFFFDAPRPKLYFKDQLSKLHFVKGVVMLSHDSFPSGHTLTAFATGVLVTYLAKNKNWGYLLVFYGIMVGFSRVYLSEHFFEDVIGGSVMGVFLAIFWIRWIDSRKFINSPAWNCGLLNLKSKV
ncbi:phosphatase PAP2 family protein [Mucilaginibacter sp.]|uniref:phosphatase PAP2 family protein n=1 Tax=Mucilaginibacter sp. TaxID=1882438 RepID=UPI002845D436|nr:phosphatase PAP2 family protein [Mucilaginibacter sp.]MDR3694705.1 phosphatase PAP2 family protein [Mucilaginibacter sp.]